MSPRLSRVWGPRFSALRGHLALAALRFVPTEAQRLLALTIAIGGVCGLAAVAFHEAIRIAQASLIDRFVVYRPPGWILGTLALPTVGGVAAGALLAYVVPNARGSGIPQVKASYAQKLGRVRLRDAFGKFFLSSMQIGMGASLGREGPTVQICAGVADALGRLFRVSPQARRRLIPVGAAAGIAAAFNAPIAAVTFTIEEIVGKLDDNVLSGVIVAAALSAVIERSILGVNPVLEVRETYGLADWRSLLVYALLGIIAGLVSVVFTDLMLGIRAMFRRMRRVPLWAQPGVGGLVTGALAVVVILATGRTGTVGGGYGSLDRALSGALPVKVMLVLCVAKLVATASSYSSGGAGGIFAPTLFIGAMLGGSLGVLDVNLFNHPPKTLGAFALVGMGAMFSGTIRAPMTSVLIIVEMTSGYSLILPLMIANMSSYVLARRFRRAPIYDALLAQDGIQLEDRRLVDALEQFTLADLIVKDRPFVSFEPGAPASEVLRRTSGPSWQDVFPVLDGEARLIGIITNEELRILAAEPELALVVTAVDLMRPAVTIKQADPLRKAFEAMRAEGLRDLPVVGDDGRILGFIDEGSLAHAYLKASEDAARTSRLP